MSINFHIKHIEELLIENDIPSIINIFENLTSKTIPQNTSLKFDGYPVIVFGKDPESGKFFLGNKQALKYSVFAYEDFDTNEFYSTHPLKKLFKELFICLCDVVEDGVYMAEVMWARNQIIYDGSAVINQNTITYYIERFSIWGNEICSKDYGIIVHTKFEGSKINVLTPQFCEVDLNKFKPSKMIWIGNTNIRYYQVEREINFSSIKNQIEILKSYSSQYIRIKFPWPNSVMNSFLNQELQKPLPRTMSTMPHNFRLYLDDKYRSEKKQKECGQVYSTIEYATFFDLLYLIVEIKNKLIYLLNERNVFEYCYWDKDKYIPCSGEGYVYKYSGGYCKLVNRSEFSRINKIRHKEQIWAEEQ